MTIVSKMRGFNIATKDYDEYIDWTFTTGGYDPSEFDNMDDYIDAILDRDPPINFDDWEDPASEPELKRQMGGFYKGTRAIQTSFIEKRGKITITAAKDKADTFIMKQNRKSRNIRSIHDRRANKINRKLSKQVTKNLVSIRKKRSANKRLTKSERKTVLQAVMFRNQELLKQINKATKQLHTKQEALSRAWNEMRLKK